MLLFAIDNLQQIIVPINVCDQHQNSRGTIRGGREYTILMQTKRWMNSLHIINSNRLDIPQLQEENWLSRFVMTLQNFKSTPWDTHTQLTITIIRQNRRHLLSGSHLEKHLVHEFQWKATYGNIKFQFAYKARDENNYKQYTFPYH